MACQSRANNYAWRKALKRAGIRGFCWHELRHTWDRWNIQQGTSLHVLQELGAWSDVPMVRKYAHLPANHLMEYADQLPGVSQGTILGKIKKGWQALTGKPFKYGSYGRT